MECPDKQLRGVNPQGRQPLLHLERGLIGKSNRQNFLTGLQSRDDVRNAMGQGMRLARARAGGYQ